MKLWKKIFLLIFFIGVFCIGINDYILVEQQHKKNVEQMQEHVLSEFQLFYENYQDSAGAFLYPEKVVDRYVYGNSDVEAALYEENDYVYNSESRFAADYESLLSVEKNERRVKIFNEEGKYYLAAAGVLNDERNMILIYTRDISQIYENRRDHYGQSVILLVIMAVFLMIIAYVFSRWITKPIKKLVNNISGISKGDFNLEFNVKESEDEIGEVEIALSRMQSELRKREEDLELEARNRQRFINGFTHEMNTPLTSVEGYSQMLRSAKLTKEQEVNALDCIIAETRRLQILYEKMKQLCLIPEEELLIENVNLAELCEEIKQELKCQLEEKQITIITEMETKEIQTDREFLRIVLSNVLRNSIIYSELDKKIVIESQRAESGIVVLISDEGNGIPQEKLQNIMEAFFRVDKSRSRKTGGMGLGLTIIAQIMEKLGGEISIESEVKKGTTVKLIFYNLATTL
ncbi:MAG: HAMP domain-containing sensor histidine kinase [Lachnospiraceae bacterium]|nr:HAMP domain-containing sensor histidine kinase [Lachnospiraceae bacterium]MDD3615969.1 HAMP domain-containing sensor histidine kinase [Lachnospiraceae bacterium]